MSDSEASEDIQGEEVRSTDGSDTEGSLRDFVVEDEGTTRNSRPWLQFVAYPERTSQALG